MYVCVVRTVCTYTSDTFKQINKIFNEPNIYCVNTPRFSCLKSYLKFLKCKNVINQAINIQIEHCTVDYD
jgi:hypothetical protein